MSSKQPGFLAEEYGIYGNIFSYMGFPLSPFP